MEYFQNVIDDSKSKINKVKNFKNSIKEKNNNNNHQIIDGKTGKIIEKTLLLKIYHMCNCKNKKDFLKYIKSNFTNENNLVNINNRNITNLSSKWSNFEIDFSFSSYNNLNKYEIKTKKINFLKFCESDNFIVILIPAILLIFLAFFITYYSTNNKIVIPVLKDLKEVDDIKWWHGIFFLIFASIFLVIIFYLLQYIKFIYTILVGFYCYFSSFYTFNYIFKSKFIKIPNESLEVNKNNKDKNNLENFDISDDPNCKCNPMQNKKITKRKNSYNKKTNIQEKNSEGFNNDNYKSIDKKQENQFDPEFIIKEKIKNSEENYNNVNHINIIVELDNKNKINSKISNENNNSSNTFDNNDNEIAISLTKCEYCENNNKQKISEEKKFDEYNEVTKNNNTNTNIVMNPIYNYRNNSILVFLNKKIINSSFIKNENSFFYYVIKLRIYELINIIIISILIFYWAESRHWILNNIFAFCLCFIMLSIFTIKNFKICIILLSCIFFYDVFWVFFSKSIFKKNVMVEVAISLNVPIKLEFPIFFSWNPLRTCMILGLGDIILPGIIIKYCRNFDFLKMNNNLKNNIGYYSLSLKLYLFSVILAFLMNFVFHHPQPVLFYIAPIFIIGLISNSVVQGEFKDFLNGENYRFTQLCVDEIINAEFSKFEEGDIKVSSEMNEKNSKNYIVLDN